MEYAKYVMIGAGGTGTHFIRPALAYLDAWHSQNSQEWDFTVVDGDTYESGNLSRQMFDTKYVGTNKATAVAEMYKQYPISAYPHFVGLDNLQSIIEEDSVVFITADNYSVRSLIEQVGHLRSNIVVINAGNERHDGSVQLWVRENGVNLTPRISYLHPEIKYVGEDDRAAMSCMQMAQLPGGEQLIIANMTAANHMLSALWRYHTGVWRESGWTEIQFDALTGKVDAIDMRERRNWNLDLDESKILFAHSR